MIDSIKGENGNQSKKLKAVPDYIYIFIGDMSTFKFQAWLEQSIEPNFDLHM